MQEIEICLTNEQLIDTIGDADETEYKPSATENIPVICENKVVGVATIYFGANNETVLYIKSPDKTKDYFKNKKYFLSYETMTPSRFRETRGFCEPITLLGIELPSLIYVPKEIHIKEK